MKKKKELKTNWFCNFLHFIEVLTLIVTILFLAMPFLEMVKAILGLILGTLYGLFIVVATIFTLGAIWFNEELNAKFSAPFEFIGSLFDENTSLLDSLKDNVIPFIVIVILICLFSFIHQWIGYSNKKDLYKSKFISSLVMLLIVIAMATCIYFVYALL